MEISEFLKTRLDEDEADAVSAMDGRSGVWTYADTAAGNHQAIDDLGYSVAEHYDIESQRWFTGSHIARHDPARVLREVDAKRKILAAHRIGVEKHRAAFDAVTGEPLPEVFDVTCETCGWAADDPASGCLTLRLLATAWSDHPDYALVTAPAFP